ncbi:MAG: CotH kinase family protein, partial [Saprospiraceae bacterium]
MKNYSYTIILLFVFLGSIGLPSLSAQQIVINEFAASNASVIEDEEDEADDWIELYNASETTVGLSGMFLSDNANNLVKWQIPEGISIPPHGFLLFWCDDQEDQGSMHTSFKLSSGGEDLLLIHSDGTTVIDSYSFGPQTTDTSTGRESDGSGEWMVFAAPSPNESNGSLGNALAKQPVASQIPGHYNNAFTLTLSTDLQDAIIRYTTDGSVPNEDDEIYNTSLTIDSTTVLRSRTFHADFIPSRTTTNTYLFGVEHDFAIFCISSDTANIFGLENGIYPNWSDDIEHEVHVEFFEPDGTFGFGQNLGIQVFGGYSQTYDHKSLSLTARSEYGANKINYPLFPDQEYSEYGALVLRNSGSDWKKTMFRDAVASGLLRDIDDVDAMIKDPDMEFQAFRPAIVYMNGQYFGIHNMREKMDWRYLETHYGIDKDEVDVVQRKDKLDQGNLDAWDDYSDFIEDADFNNAEDMETLKTWIDPDHFADYFLAEIYLDNTDWPGNNNRRWRERKPGKQWRYFLYDLDRVMGLIPLVDDYNSGNWSSPSLEYVTQDSSTYSWNQE